MNEIKYDLIGFTGKIGVGKTTLADIFVKRYDFVKLSFMTPLKKACVKLTGLPMIYFTDIKLKEEPIPGLDNITPRIFMQLMGTEFARTLIHPDFWLWRMRQSFIENETRKIVIDDVRFDNEAELIRGHGGLVIHLNRHFESPTTETEHVSENAITVDPHDHLVSSDLPAGRIAEYIYEEVLTRL